MPSSPKRTNNVPKLAQGVLLIAEPFLSCEYFKRSIVFLTDHDDKGTMGLILNKDTEVKLNDAVEDFPEFDAPLYFGGPVETDTLFYLHTIGEKLPGSRRITDNVWWGGDYDQLKFLIDTKQIGSDQIRFFAGYSGWEPKQAQKEVKEKAWIVCLNEIQKACFWKENPRNMWSWVLKSMGNEYAILANFPEDPSLN